MMVAKYDLNGRLIWARSFGGAAGDGGNEIAVTDAGEIAVAMIADGPTAIDGTAFAGGGGTRDSYLLRLASDGALRWVAAFNGAGTERIRAVTMNEAGEVWAGFQYRGTLLAAGRQFPAAGDWDGAVVKLDARGVQLWARPVAGVGEDNLRGLAASPDGAVYVSGLLSGAGDLLGRPVAAAGGGGDDYLARLSRDGEIVWIVDLAGAGTSVGPEIRADARGVILSTTLEGSAVLRRDGATLATVAASSGRSTSLLAAFAPDGRPRFIYTTRPQGSNDAIAGSVPALSRDGRLAAQALRFSGTAAIGGRVFATAAERDSAIVLLDLNGS